MHTELAITPCTWTSIMHCLCIVVAVARWRSSLNRIKKMNIWYCVTFNTSTIHKENTDLSIKSSNDRFTTQLKIRHQSFLRENTVLKALKNVSGDTKHHRCLLFSHPTHTLYPIKSNSGPITAVMWCLARLLWLVCEYKVSIIHPVPPPSSSIAADYGWWFTIMIILGFV